MLERAAIERLKNGQLEAMELLVRRYHLKGVRAAYLITGDRDLAEDIVQTKFVELPDNIRHFDAGRPFSPWFLRSVINAAINAAKHRSHTVSLEAEQFSGVPVMESWLTGAHPDPESALESKEMREDVIRALQRLTPEQRAAVILRYYLELDEQEMVESLQLPRSTVKWRLHAARRMLRGLLHVHAPSAHRGTGRPAPRAREE